MKTQINEEETIVNDNLVQDVQENKETKTESINDKDRSWRNVMVGGVSGIMLGSLSMLAAGFRHIGPDVPVPPQPDPDPELNVIPVAESVNNDMSFRVAFETARAEVGPGGAFCWHGNVYSTYSANDPEWLEMTPEQRDEHCHEIIEQVHPEPYVAPRQDPVVDPQPPVHEPETQDEVDVHIIAVENLENESGETLQVGIGSVDGQTAIFADVSGDGIVDTVIIDLDGSESFEENEMRPSSEVFGNNEVTMADLEIQAEANSGRTIDDTIYDDMPDYTNDANVSEF